CSRVELYSICAVDWSCRTFSKVHERNTKMHSVTALATHRTHQLKGLSLLSVALSVLVVMFTVPARANAQTMPVLPPDFNDTEFARFVVYPTALAFAPDGRIFITEKYGRVRVVKNGALLATPFVTRAV